MNVLLTSAGRRTYLVKYFKSALAGSGEVIVANSADCPSFSVADKHVIAPLIYSPNYIPFLLDLCRRESVGLVVPLFDVDIPVLARNSEKFLEIGARAVVPSPEVAEICADKLSSAHALQAAGIPVPVTAASIGVAREMLRSGALCYPLVVKPRWGMGSIGVHTVYTEEELHAACVLVQGEIERSYLRYETAKAGGNSYLVQEKIQGQEYGMDVMCDLESHFRGVVVRRKLAMRSGETDCAVVVRDECLEHLGARIAECFSHPGNMDVDIFVTEDGPKVLEMNARFGGGYPFSHVAGVDLPKALIAWAKGEDVPDATLVSRSGVNAYKDIAIVRRGRNY